MMTHDEFVENECHLCGSQRCYGVDYCGKYKKEVLGEKDDYDPYTGKYAFCPPMTDEEFSKAYKDYMDEYRTDDDDVSDEEYEAAAQEAHDELVRSLIEAGGEIRELNDEKKRLIFALKEAVEWLDYFLTTERDNIYYDEASEARCRAEYLLMEMEDTE